MSVCVGLKEPEVRRTWKRAWILGVKRRLGVQNSGLVSPSRRLAETSAGEVVLASGWEE